MAVKAFNIYLNEDEHAYATQVKNAAKKSWREVLMVGIKHLEEEG